MTALRKKLRRVDDDTRKGVRKEVAGLARLTRDYARDFVAPVSSNIASSISDRIDRDGMGARVGVIGRAAQRRVWYAHFVEWGTRASTKTRHPGLLARPFLTPGWELARQKFEPKLRAEIEKIINRLSDG